VNTTLGVSQAQVDRRQQAVIARWFWGPNQPDEAIYPTAIHASDGQPLSGSKRYTIHLPADDLPPVDAFWSFTVYGADMFLVPGDARHASINGNRPDLVRNPDGSIDVAISTTPPPGAAANWLAAPAGPFNLVMRLYLPRAAVLDGSYAPPPITVAP
jgi:hypothetical protein